MSEAENWYPNHTIISLVNEVIENFINENSIKPILNSKEAYEILDNSTAGESTWCAGGCAILAHALNMIFRYDIYVIYDYGRNQIDHFVVKTPNNTYIDCDGEQKNILDNFKRKEGLTHNKNLVLIPYSEDLRNNGIPVDMRASRNLGRLIKSRLNPAQS
jgi:hypothetical protein